jgi:hypothetical protein
MHTVKISIYYLPSIYLSLSVRVIWLTVTTYCNTQQDAHREDIYPSIYLSVRVIWLTVTTTYCNTQQDAHREDIYLSIVLQPTPVGSWPLFQFPDLFTQSVGLLRPLPAHGTAYTQNKCIQTPMPRVGFEPTIPVFERAKTVHTLDRAATVIGTHTSRNV